MCKAILFFLIALVALVEKRGYNARGLHAHTLGQNLGKARKSLGFVIIEATDFWIAKRIGKRLTKVTFEFGHLRNILMTDFMALEKGFCLFYCS